MSKIVRNSDGKKKKRVLFEKVLDNEPVNVYYSEGATVNIGDFESVKVSYAISLPTTKENIEEVRKDAEKYIRTLIDKRVEEIKNGF